MSKGIRMLGRMLAWALAAVLLVYGAWVAANLHDRRPNAADMQLSALYAQRPTLAEAENGYVHAQAMAREHGTAARSGKQDDMLVAIKEACREVTRACLSFLQANQTGVGSVVAKQTRLLEQYRLLIPQRGWRDPGPLQNSSDSNFAILFDGQRQLMLDAWLRAGAGDLGGIGTQLDADMRFWRMLLAAQSDLLTKAMATAGVRRNLQWGSAILARVPAARQAGLIPPAWSLPLTADERAMLPAFAAEREFYRHSIGDLKVLALGANDEGDDVGDSGAWRGWLVAAQVMLAGPVHQPQDTLNRYAELLVEIGKPVDPNYVAFAKVEVPQARAAMREMHEATRGFALYNPVGNRLLHGATDGAGLSGYGVRVADLEGLRRAALLAAQLRASGVAPAQVPARLARAALRQPYDGTAFSWDAGQAALVFTGLEPAPRGQHRLMY